MAALRSRGQPGNSRLQETSNLELGTWNLKEAQGLWEDPDLLQIPARTEGEKRFLVVARIDEKHWSAIITYRDGLIRIISVRRSREEEVQLYES